MPPFLEPGLSFHLPHGPQLGVLNTTCSILKILSSPDFTYQLGNLWKAITAPGKNASRPKMISFMKAIMQMYGHFKDWPCEDPAEKGESVEFKSF